MSAILTPNAAAFALRQMAKLKDRVYKVQIYRNVGKARNLAVAEFLKRGVGRSIFGETGMSALLKARRASRKVKSKKASINSLLKPRAITRSGDTHTGGFIGKGFFALQELGGKTKAHEIKPKLSKLLAFTKGGMDVFARRVHHPGSRSKAFPVLEQVAREMVGPLRADVDRGLQELANHLRLD